MNIVNSKNIALKTFVMPADLNFHGTLFGGAMMSYLDQAGAIVAQNRSHSRVFLVAMNKANFTTPAHLNDAITFYGDVIKVGRTSMTVKLEVWREDPITGEQEKSAESEAIYVAIDENLKPWPVDRP
jgi:acyl-CoA thioesterase YciA